MAHLNSDHTKTIYDNYDDYVNAQNARSHDYDCPNCLKLNTHNYEYFLSITKYNPKKMLDIGCRDAGWFPLFTSKGMTCTGVDISPKSVAYAQSQKRDVRLVSLTNLLDVVDDGYDFILSNHSFEHILNPIDTLRHCRKILTGDGYMVIRLPDENGKLKKNKTHAHVEAFTEQKLHDLFRRSGFIIVHQTRMGNDWYFILQKEKPISLIDVSKLPLLSVPDDNWTNEYNAVLSDPFIRKKYNRKERVQNKINYVEKFLPEIKNAYGYVLDIGPGPGEFLEICRYYGNEIIGLDSTEEAPMMGNKYLKLSQLMTARQKIDVHYSNFFNAENKINYSFNNDSLTCINSQGSIEQVFSKFMQGPKPPHKWSWVKSELLEQTFNGFIQTIQDILMTGGILFIYANGSGNDNYYHSLIESSIAKVGHMKLISTNKSTIHKIEKI